MTNTRAFKKRPTADVVDKIARISDDVASHKSPLEPVPSVAANTKTNYIVGQTYEVPVKEIIQNPLNARRVVSQASLDEFAIKLKQEGQTTAALGYINAEGQVCLIDGHRRLAAIRINEFPKLRVEIRPEPADKKELYKSSRSANKDRENQTPLDDALAWKHLLDTGVYVSQAELAADQGEDITVVSRILGLATLPKSLIGMLAERPAMMNLRMLDALKKFNDVAGEEQTEALILEVASKDLSSRDVDARRVSLQKTPVTRARSAMRTEKYDKGNSILKRFTGQGRLILEIRDVTDEKDIDLLNEELAKVVAKYLSSN